MNTEKIQRALIAVYDKTGITDFARTLVEEFHIEILSTGGTARHLSKAGVPVTMVEQVTGFPEMLDGRVKSLHPRIHAGLLADRDNSTHMRQLQKHEIAPIDMVVVNLYPFEETVSREGCTFDEAVEMIDIGGPCMLRAAAKNHKHVVVISNDGDFETVLSELRLSGDVCRQTRQRLARTVFDVTADYDLAIRDYLEQALEDEVGGPGEALSPWFDDEVAAIGFEVERLSPLRYGENPDQAASVWLTSREPSECNLLEIPTSSSEPRQSPLIAGEMSFNNYADGDGALTLVKELTRAFGVPRNSTRPVSGGQPSSQDPNELRASARGSLAKEALDATIGKYAVAFIKHTNACGCAIGDDPIDTYRRAYLGDPVAAAGGVLCMNFPVTREVAETVMNTFSQWGRDAGAAFFTLDVWIAPAFDDDALALITTPTPQRSWGMRCRLLAVGAMDTPWSQEEVDFKRITHGMLVQQRDTLSLNEEAWKIASKRTPSAREMADLRLAWLICKQTKSNAITIVRDGQLLGNGAGQMSRVKSCDLAVQLATENGHSERLAGAVAASDAFFPVPDGPGKLMEAGITALIQPGGSRRDADTVDACDQNKAALIITGTRHFKH